jgi:hypothetical protein
MVATAHGDAVPPEILASFLAGVRERLAVVRDAY